MNRQGEFKKQIETMLDEFLIIQSNRFPSGETLTIDLHCHDRNSNVPDELLGRILGVPETWLESDDLMKVLKEHGCNTYTVTNHNNARSCYELLEKGHDVLVGAEWSCMVPDYRTGIHVLAYGFTPEQEKKLNKLRTDIYRFQEYTADQDIPTIWAHPLYHYNAKGVLPLDFFDKMALLFDRFETINGQRDTWQNMLVKTWVETLTLDKINELSKKFSIAPDKYCRNPHNKAMAGGSDSHMGIFTGLTGTRLHVPDLRTMTDKTNSQLALEAIKKGRMAPFGSHNDSEKMAVTFLDYFCQIGINMKDPGLIRMLLHKGEPKEKMLAFTLVNGFMELKRHKTTLNFLKLFHDCFSGKGPGKTAGFIVPRDYKEVFKLATGMAAIRRNNPDKAMKVFDQSIHKIFENLILLLIARAEKKFSKLDKNSDLSSIRIEEIISTLELPGHFRSLVGDDNNKKHSLMNKFNLAEFFDGLSFPFLASAVIVSSFFTSARVMYKSRSLINQFSENQGVLRQRERTLWLTDTFEDSNGVAMVLKSMLAEIRKRDLPVDILTASKTMKSGDHYIAVRPLAEYRLPFYEQQPLRIPNLLEIHRLFQEGEYTRIICSTEGPMGLIALYLKQAYSVPAYFYVHTDWMMFAEKVLQFDVQNRDRLRRLLRAFYRGFDGLFVLNNDQRKWLIGRDMGFDPSKVFLTAHWAEDGFRPTPGDRKQLFGISVNDPIILFAGRLSEEKGVSEIPAIMKRVRSKFPGAVMAFAGMGPMEDELKALMPDAKFLGWVDHENLPAIYSAADLLLLPSRFDTFGCVVLEALSCGLPVIAYKTKGPKDIIMDGINGYLVKNQNDMAQRIIDYLGDARLRARFKRESLKRAKSYDPDIIISRFMNDLNSAA